MGVGKRNGLRTFSDWFCKVDMSSSMINGICQCSAGGLRWRSDAVITVDTSDGHRGTHNWKNGIYSIKNVLQI